MSTPRWQAVSSRSVPTDVSAHRSEGIKPSRSPTARATYSMHTLCTTHGTLCEWDRHVRTPEIFVVLRTVHVACYVHCSIAKRASSVTLSTTLRQNANATIKHYDGFRLTAVLFCWPLTFDRNVGTGIGNSEQINVSMYMYVNFVSNR